ncbi:MAG: hypothetical protein R2991_05695 [Thermoanaerobaculia bacterium]
MSEYDPLFGGRVRGDERDLDQVLSIFERAGRPFLRSPWSWAAWALVLPAAALATGPVASRWGALAVLLLWSAAVLAGGFVEAALILRQPTPRTALAAWVLRAQGNLSLVAVAISLLLVLGGEPWALPAVWLLLVGHSLYTLGGLSFPPLRRTGLLYQVAGVGALIPQGRPLWIFAAATAVGNLWVAWELARTGRDQELPR